MKTAIIFSKPNSASLNIYECIKDFNFDKNISLHIYDESPLYLNNIDKKINADLFIFPCSHKSDANINALTVHPIGNFDKALFGGKPKTLVPVNPFYLSNLYRNLVNNSRDKYQVTLECTHHGPFLNKPSIFIEIGSDEQQYKDKNAGMIIAKTIFDVLQLKQGKNEIAFGLGGNHYCSTFNKILLKTNILIGHICPKHYLSYLDESLLKQFAEETKK